MYLFSRIRHLKKIILKWRGFRCGSDEKMMRMWFGLEIDVVGLPPLTHPLTSTNPFCFLLTSFFFSSWIKNKHQPYACLETVSWQKVSLCLINLVLPGDYLWRRWTCRFYPKHPSLIHLLQPKQYNRSHLR